MQGKSPGVEMRLVDSAHSYEFWKVVPAGFPFPHLCKWLMGLGLQHTQPSWVLRAESESDGRPLVQAEPESDGHPLVQNEGKAPQLQTMKSPSLSVLMEAGISLQVPLHDPRWRARKDW